MTNKMIVIYLEACGNEYILCLGVIVEAKVTKFSWKLYYQKPVCVACSALDKEPNVE
jgi:hypothetical protein